MARPPPALISSRVTEFRYRECAAKILTEGNGQPPINFIKIECKRLKDTLIDHCVQWQRHLTDLLNDNARKELFDIGRIIEETTTKLRSKPVSLEQLSESLKLHASTKSSLSANEKRFEPLEAMYAMLAKYDVVVREEESTALMDLRERWLAFGLMLSEADATLTVSKNSMKRDLQSALDAFAVHVVDARRAAQKRLPYADTFTVAAAKEMIAEVAASTAETRGRERELKPGRDIFDIPEPECKELVETETELEQLRDIWQITEVRVWRRRRRLRWCQRRALRRGQRC